MHVRAEGRHEEVQNGSRGIQDWTLKQRNDMKWSKKMNPQNMNKKTGTLEAGMKEVRNILNAHLNISGPYTTNPYQPSTEQPTTMSSTSSIAQSSDAESGNVCFNNCCSNTCFCDSYYC